MFQCHHYTLYIVKLHTTTEHTLNICHQQKNVAATNGVPFVWNLVFIQSTSSRTQLSTLYIAGKSIKWLCGCVDSVTGELDGVRVSGGYSIVIPLWWSVYISSNCPLTGALYTQLMMTIIRLLSKLFLWARDML